MKANNYNISLLVRDSITCIEFPLCGQLRTMHTNPREIAERWLTLHLAYIDKDIDDYGIIDYVVTLA